jgi:hypothetical protein
MPTDPGRQQPPGHHTPTAQRLGDPELITIDESQQQQQADKDPAGKPKEGLGWIGPHGRGLGKQHQDPESTAERFHSGIAQTDGSLAMAAATAEREPGEHWNVFKPGQNRPTTGAMAWGPKHRVLPRHAPHNHIQKTSHTSPEESRQKGDLDFKPRKAKLA